jgi:hypothetical protein
MFAAAPISSIISSLNVNQQHATTVIFHCCYSEFPKFAKLQNDQTLTAANYIYKLDLQRERKLNFADRQLSPTNHKSLILHQSLNVFQPSSLKVSQQPSLDKYTHTSTTYFICISVPGNYLLIITSQ